MDIPHEGSILNSPWTYWLDKWFYWLLVAGILVNASGLLLPVLEPDGALYATISKNMLLSGDYINLRVDGNDWLDKPHFPFWIAALSFKIFGINSFAYKFPALLFWIAGARYTYAFAKKLYNRQVAQLSVLIYISVEHLIISNNDVRAEPYLTGLVIASAFYYYVAYKDNKWIFVLPGSLFMGMAVMTKGIFIPVMVISGFIIEWIVKKKWSEFLKFRWWLAILLLILFISPELICLYIQFDMHPEKLVFGTTKVSGLRFFFWDSQFGRFFNTGPIKGKGDLLFYVHTLLWAFLPWSVFPILILVSKIKKGPRLFGASADYVCGGIFISGFVIFSLSRFQLPHYLNFLYPFLAILVAKWLCRPENPVYQKIAAYTQNFICLVFFGACLALMFFYGLRPAAVIIPGLVAAGIIIYRFFPGNGIENITGRSFSAVLVVNLFLNGLFYPDLFRYQSGMAAASYLEKNNVQNPVYLFSELFPEFSFEFYSKQPVLHLKKSDLYSLKDSILIFTSQSNMDSLRKSGFVLREIKTFRHFHISRLTGTFINHHTRNQVVDSSGLAVLFPPTGSNYK